MADGVQLTILLIAILALSRSSASTSAAARALSARPGSNLSKLHSMPSYHGWYVALWCGIPSGIVLIVWLIIEAPILEALLLSYLGPAVAEQSDAMIGLSRGDVLSNHTIDRVEMKSSQPAIPAAQTPRSSS